MTSPFLPGPAVASQETGKSSGNTDEETDEPSGNTDEASEEDNCGSIGAMQAIADRMLLHNQGP